ncbi:MAG: NfeD family protein [Crocinitomicaceae bacterium]|tara:strand:- start:13581 stop:14015 length:435 start_codon:yes stop_codon:yes gene_type:complete
MDQWHILVTIGIVAFILEIFTTGFISGSIGIGLLSASVGSYLGLETNWQILLFAFGVALTYFLIRPIITKYGYRENNEKTNIDALIDRTGSVTQEINHFENTGRVKIDGDDWKASTKNNEIIKVGTTIKVVAIESIILFVKPLK